MFVVSSTFTFSPQNRPFLHPRDSPCGHFSSTAYATNYEKWLLPGWPAIASGNAGQKFFNSQFAAQKVSLAA
jgi:hypothetical protein